MRPCPCAALRQCCPYFFERLAVVGYLVAFQPVAVFDDGNVRGGHLVAGVGYRRDVETVADGTLVGRLVVGHKGCELVEQIMVLEYCRHAVLNQTALSHHAADGTAALSRRVGPLYDAVADGAFYATSQESIEIVV